MILKAIIGVLVFAFFILLCIFIVNLICMGLNNRDRYEVQFEDEDKSNNHTMKWFICCVIIIFFGLGLFIGLSSGITIHVVQTAIDDYNYKNLLILYDIKE